MKRGRPPKRPEDRRTADIKIPLSDSEKELIRQAAEIDEQKHVTWARGVLLEAAKRQIEKNGG